MRDLIYKTTPNTKVVSYNHELVSIEFFAQKRKLIDGYGYVLNIDQPAKAIELEKDMALLLLTIKEQQQLPDFVRSSLDQELIKKILDLIYNGFISVFKKSKFITGSEAAGILESEYGSNVSLIPKLSELAVKRSALMGLKNADHLFYYLYGYNSYPIDPKKRNSFENDWEFLLSQGFNPNSWAYEKSNKAWYYFSKPNYKHNENGKNYKLYFSPKPKFLPAVLREVGNVLNTIDNVSFKVGKGLAGIIRPDKFVAYFSELDTLQNAATRILAATKGVEAQGVPFTISIDHKGLLSWGMDVDVSKVEQQSWRQWMVNTMVEAIGDENKRSANSTWSLASLALYEEGIDPITFKPNSNWKHKYQKK